MNRNYQRELDGLITEQEKSGCIPSLFLHSCCAPCSSYCLEYLSEYFKVTLFYYNPNIYPPQEYTTRVEEQKRLIEELMPKNPIRFMEGRYEPREFYTAVKGLEKEPEGGERCIKCYELRLKEAAKFAKEGGFDYFTTSLSISPLKKADKLMEIGTKLSEEFGVAYLPSDFKKKGGYQRSVLMSKEHHLYRQDYCGCIFSLRTTDTA